MRRSEAKKRSRQAQATHRCRRADIIAKRPVPSPREGWQAAERRKRMIFDPWRAAAYVLLPAGLKALTDIR